MRHVQKRSCLHRPGIACVMLFACLGQLGGMTLAAAGGHAQETMQPQAQTVLCFGDSLTAGDGPRSCAGVPALIQER